MHDLEIEIRLEGVGDKVAIHDVNAQAFGRPDEAVLVDKLRQHSRLIASFVAVAQGQIVGHVLFTPVTIVAGEHVCDGVGLGPVAVLPNWQKQGIGDRLIRAGIAHCTQLGHSRLIVLGHSDYYPRFGFVPASRYGVRYVQDVPDDVFMALSLVPNGFSGCEGVVHYAPEFG